MAKENSNVKKILLNALWMLFDKVFILILNLAVTVRVANHYGSLGYGMYQYAVSVVAIFEILVGFVDGRVVKKRYAQGNPDDLVLNATVTRLLFSIFSLVCGIIYLLLSSENREYAVIFFILLANAIILNLRFGMKNRYEYLLKSKRVIVASNISLFIGGILQLTAVSLDLPIIVIAIITAVSSFISLIIVYWQYRREFGRILQGHYNGSLVKELIIESVPLAIAASCAVIYSRCDSIMIGNMMSKMEVGIYAIAVKLVHVITMALSPIRESVYPKMIELYYTNKKSYATRYVQATAIMTWLYVVGVLISFVVLPFAFKYLKPEYAKAFPLYQVYVIGAFFMYNSGLRAGHYTLINRGSILMHTQIVSVVLNIILNYIFINNIGIFGAAIATGITQCVSLFISNLFFGKEGREVFLWQVKGLNPLHVLK